MEYSIKAIVQGIVKANNTHLKSDCNIKLTAVMNPIEPRAANNAIGNAPEVLVRKEVWAKYAVNIPVVRI